MNHLLNITRKELKELLTPGSLISIVFVVILFMALGQGMSGETEKASAPSVIGVIYESDSPDTDTAYGDITYRNLVQGAYIALYGSDADVDNIHDMESPYGDSKAICKELSDRGYKYAVAVPKTISTNIEDKKPTPIPVYYVFKDGGVFSTVSAASATSLIVTMSDIIANKAIQDKATVDPVMAAVIAQPLVTGGNADHTLINGEVYDGITPSEIYNAQMSQSMMIPIVVMIVITMVGSVIITSMGSEKENKTLETLLTMPVRRTTIVSGKLLAAAVMGLIYGIFYLIGMLFYTNGMTSGLTSSVNLDDYGLSMNAGSWAILFAVLFLAIFTALGMCMILGAFTKNYKMAQTMVMPITVLAIIPMMVFMFSDWNSLPPVLQGIMFAIPFSHPMMAMTNLMLGNTMLIAAGAAYLAVLDIVLVIITVRLYNSDILITGLDKAAIKRRLGMKDRKRGKTQ